MIDQNLLRSLGWSNELIDSAMDVSRTLNLAPQASMTDPVVGISNEIVLHGSQAGSQRLDVSGPPVAHQKLNLG
jgi:hypothetical protein